MIVSKASQFLEKVGSPSLQPILQHPHPSTRIQNPARTIAAHRLDHASLSVNPKGRGAHGVRLRFRIPQQDRVPKDPVFAFEVSAAEVHVKAAIRVQVQCPPSHGSIRKCAEDRGFGCATRQTEEEAKDEKVLLEGSDGIHVSEVRGNGVGFQGWSFGEMGMAWHSWKRA